MKTVIFLGDGMADYPVPSLQNRTPLAAADKPAMNRIAREGRNGLFRTIEPDMPTGSAVANLSVLGYDPLTAFQGRGVLEAASLGVSLSDTDLAMRVNLICIADGKIKSHSAGHISDEEAGLLIRDLQELFRDQPVSLTQGLSYRHLLVMPGGNVRIECAPPHDHIGEPAANLMVRAADPGAAETAGLLNRLIRESQAFLSDHPVNRNRTSKGKDPANSLWPWSPGRKPAMQTFQQRFGIRGAAISAVDLIKGLAVYAGFDVIPVQGATGLYNTNYEGKADACLSALENHDLVYVHVEAADEAGHEKDAALKVRCIEDMDKRLIQRVWDGLGGKLDHTVIALLPDHATPVSSGAHVRDPVPVAIRDPRFTADGVDGYDEEQAQNGSLGLLSGAQFIKTVLQSR